MFILLWKRAKIRTWLFHEKQFAINGSSLFCRSWSNAFDFRHVKPNNQRFRAISRKGYAVVNSVDDSDTFGNLQTSLERRMPNKKMNTSRCKSVRSCKPGTGKVKENVRFKDVVSLKFSNRLTGNDASLHLDDSKVRKLKEKDEANEFGLLGLSDGEVNCKEFLNTEFLKEDKNDDDSTEVKITDVKRKRIIDYAHDMRNLARSGRLKDALDLMDLLNGDVRVKHESPFLFTVLIGLCGRVGYTAKAFSLFRQLKDRGLKVTPAVLTGLFNSCAECPFPEYGLKQARYLYESMQTKGWHPSTITYRSMIKAFGRCGDMEKAFELVDEMIDNKHPVTSETFSFLLMACITDKVAGFTHALSVVRKMKRMRILPTSYIYDLLLRAARDCGVGPPEVAAKLLLDRNVNIGEWKTANRLQVDKSKLLPSSSLIESGKRQVVKSASREKVDVARSNIIVKQAKVTEETNRECVDALELKPKTKVVDLLSGSLQDGNSQVVALSEIRYASDRLNLLGGIQGVLSMYEEAGICPSIKTFTILLACIPSQRDMEMHLLAHLMQSHVTPDVDFFNVLMKKRALRHDVNGGKNVLDLVREYGLKPNVATFGVLAMMCRSQDESRRFLSDLQLCNVRPNIEMFGALVHAARANLDFRHLVFLLQSMRDCNVQPNSRILKVLEEAKMDGKRIVIAKEERRPVAACLDHLGFEEYYKKFNLYYSQWLKSVEIELPQHPWQQYREK